VTALMQIPVPRKAVKKVWHSKNNNYCMSVKNRCDEKGRGVYD